MARVEYKSVTFMKKAKSKRHRWIDRILALTVWLVIGDGVGQEPAALVRQTTLTLPESLPSGRWQVSNAFGTTVFSQPMGTATAPGESDTIYVLERRGRVIRFHIPTRQKTTFLDIATRVNTSGEGGLLGLAFHPEYLNNGRFFVFYTLTASNGSGNGFHTRISRFELSENGLGDPASEAVLISQYNQASNHNGGDVHFGPDGYLYAALGDEGGGNDTYQNSQRIDKDFFAGLIRLDVDEMDVNLPPNPHPAMIGNYRIPRDNPYVGASRFLNQPVATESVRTEFYAVGLRNPFRFSFDPLNGWLYVGDVGQDKLEEIDIIEKGGNYGWNFREGQVRGPRFSANVGFKEPIYDYAHGSGSMQGSSVTGGVVYRGNRFPELFGKYVFGDYVSGNWWQLTAESASVRVTAENIIRGIPNISSFGYDPMNGDILATQLSQGVIYRLSRSTATGGDSLPDLLSETGAFSDLAQLTPNSGIYPYEINHPFWSDGAHKNRWFGLPEGNALLDFENRNPVRRIPVGSVWIKHFEMEMIQGEPTSRRRLETRFIIKTADHIYGVTYRWNAGQTDAELVPEDGDTETLEVIRDGQVVPQIWRYPSRSECLHCHSTASGGVLGFSRHQLNRSIQWQGPEAKNQLALFEESGFLQSSTATGHRVAVSISDETVGLSHKVASYLDSNCASCHLPGGPAVGNWDARITTPLWQKNLLGGLLVRGESESEKALIVPGSPDFSAVVSRMSVRGARQMPPIATHVADASGVALIREWITSTLGDFTLPSQTWENWYVSHFGESPSGKDLARLDSDVDGTPDFLEYLLDTDPKDATSGWKFSTIVLQGDAHFEFPPVPERGLELQILSGSTPNGPWSSESVRLNSLQPTQHTIPVGQSRSFFFRVVLSEPF